MTEPAAPVAPPAARTISQAPIKPIDPAQFGKKAELTEKLKAILKDVPVLHERLKTLIVDLEKTSIEFKAATEKATAIAAEWEKIK
jgi:hypothetical protein